MTIILAMRYWLRRVLRFLSLLELAETASIRLRGAQEHGHALLLDILETRDLDGALIEVGCTREQLEGQGSTSKLAVFAANRGLHFITVDMDPENIARVKRQAQTAGIRLETHTGLGEEFLTNYEGVIAALYLDAFDIDHGLHGAARQDAYRKHLGTEITDQAAAAMHLAAVQGALDKLAPSAVIVIDDTWPAGRRWRGKGATAVPFLIANGFEVIEARNNAVALQHH